MQAGLSATPEPCRKGLVAVGDSITAGEGSMALGVTPLSWAQWLARALDLPFSNYAVNGATAADMLREQLPRVRADYDVAVLYAGVNDVRSGDWDPAAYARDLDALAAGLAARAPRLLMLTLPLDLGRPTSAPKPAAASAIVRDVAQRHGAAVADLGDFGGWTLVLPDVVHPTALGQLDIADRAARALGAVDPLPSALAPTFSHGRARYAPAHARMLWHDLVRRGYKRVRRP
jgi:lysophospholipase L1-like esterase